MVVDIGASGYGIVKTRCQTAPRLTIRNYVGVLPNWWPSEQGAAAETQDVDALQSPLKTTNVESQSLVHQPEGLDAADSIEQARLARGGIAVYGRREFARR